MDNTRAGLLMVAAMAIFAVEDALLKVLSGSVPVGQLLVMMGVGGGLVLWPFARRRGVPILTGAALRGAVLVRNLAEFVAAVGFITALSLIPLSTASAILQAVPLAVTLGAALFLGETVGWRRWLAVAVGLLGVLMILRPGTDGFDANALWAVVGVTGLAARDLATRRIGRSVATEQLTVWGFLALIPAGLLLLALSGPPVTVGARDGLMLLAVLVLGTVGYTVMTLATQVGDLSAIAPLRYSRLAFAMAIAALAFGERPDAWTVAGAGLVVGSGLYTLVREARLRRAARRAAAPPSPAVPPPV